MEPTQSLMWNETEIRTMEYPRSFEYDPRPPITTIRVPPKESLSPGAFCMRCADGSICHVQPSQDENGGFAGILEHKIADDGEAQLRTRGNVSLRIADVTTADIGKRVFAYGANLFSLDPEGGLEVGRIRNLEEKDYATVSFKSFDDPKPLDLTIRGPKPSNY